MAKESVEKNFPLSKERVQKMLEGLPGGKHFITGDMVKPNVVIAPVRRIGVPEDPEEEEMLGPEEMMREIRLLRGRVEDLEMTHYSGVPPSKKNEFSKLLRDFRKLAKKVEEIEQHLPPDW
jgi:hypothetical protein